MPRFELDTGADEPSVVEHAGQLGVHLPLVLSGTYEFLIVGAADGSYTQTAEVHGKLIVEWRSVSPDGSFSHYNVRVPRAGGERRRRPLPGAEQGCREDELLDVEQAADAFRQFMTTGHIGPPFELDDRTQWFLDNM